MTTQRVVLFDIENSPSLGYVWGKYQQDVVEFAHEWYVLSVAYKWLDKKKVHAYALPDFNTYKKDKQNDKELVQKIWDILNEADIVIAHNGDRFDVRKVNARFLFHGMKPPSPYKTIDTVKIARKYFLMNSNKLDHIGNYLDVGRKEETGGFGLWTKCMSGDMKAWEKMKKYNKQDVVLLEKVYKKLRHWNSNNPNINADPFDMSLCGVCGSVKSHHRGTLRVRGGHKPKIQCQDCGAWRMGPVIKNLP